MNLLGDPTTQVHTRWGGTLLTGQHQNISKPRGTNRFCRHTSSLVTSDINYIKLYPHFQFSVDGATYCNT